MKTHTSLFKVGTAGLLMFFLCSCGYSQTPVSTADIVDQYQTYKEPSLTKRRITRGDLDPLISRVKQDEDFTVEKVGESIEGRDLTLISTGSGDTSVFLWSQMHGDESTATMALFDIFNFLRAEGFEDEKQFLREHLNMHFLPMLNPDGAEMFNRRNALGIDVNRDALRLQSPEGQTLKRVRDSLDADWGFNLHDQSKYYNPEGIAKPATISFLAPAYDFEKSIDEKRADAMKLIVVMNEQLQQHIPEQVARYNDDFEPRAFGDNIQKWGTRTILIESGGQYDDPEKQEIRKLNFIAILSALFSIADESYQQKQADAYNDIPHNDRKLFDLKLIGLTYELKGKNYILDLGINHNEQFARNALGYYYRGSIADQGDLSTNYAYESVDVSGYRLVPGKVYPTVQDNLEAVGSLNFDDLLSKGISYVKAKNLSGNRSYVDFPIQVVPQNFKVPVTILPGRSATFFLEKDGKLEYAIINGFFHRLGDSTEGIKNGTVLK